MTQTIYETQVTALGDLVPTFREAGMLVFFGANAPEELHEFCILHEVTHKEDALRAGDVVTICLPEQRKDLAAMLRKASIAVTPENVTPASAAVTSLVGEVAEYVKPAPRVVQQQQPRGTSTGANAQRKRAQRENRSVNTGRAANATRSRRPQGR